MQANEFEKKVQQVMGEFKISPSAGVWHEVEQRLQDKRKKRRVLLFIAFSSIGLTLAGYGIYNSSHQQSNSKNGIVSQQKINEKDNNAVKQTLVPQDSRSGTSKTQSENAQQYRNKTVETKTTSTASHNDGTQGVLTTNSLVDVKGPDRDFFGRTTKSIEIIDNSLPPNGKRPLTVSLDQNIQSDPVRTTISVTTAVDASLVKILKSNSTQQHQKTPARMSKSLKWGINFSAGSSVITDNHFPFKNSVARADMSYSSPGASTGGGGAARLPASSNESVFAFKAGIVVKKEISARSQLSAGLQYAYLGDHIKAATASTQSSSQQGSTFNLSSYYSAAPQKTHEDRFHFIELPILYHWRMSKNDKHFLSLNAGASAGYLLGSNALIYDTSYGGIYFHDESLLTKTHFNIISGVSYHVTGINGFEWSIGPQFSFDLSRIIKSDVDKRRYLLYAGIDTRVFFEKKKNK